MFIKYVGGGAGEFYKVFKKKKKISSPADHSGKFHGSVTFSKNTARPFLSVLVFCLRLTCGSISRKYSG